MGLPVIAVAIAIGVDDDVGVAAPLRRGWLVETGYVAGVRCQDGYADNVGHRVFLPDPEEGSGILSRDTMIFWAAQERVMVVKRL